MKENVYRNKFRSMENLIFAFLEEMQVSDPHFIECPFYREKIAVHFGEIAVHFPISSNPHFIASVL